MFNTVSDIEDMVLGGDPDMYIPLYRHIPGDDEEDRSDEMASVEECGGGKRFSIVKHVVDLIVSLPGRRREGQGISCVQFVV